MSGEGGGQKVKLGATHRLAGQPFPVTDLHLTVQPHRRHLLQPLEAEGVELEGGAAVFGVFIDGHRAVGGAAGGQRRKARVGFVL